MMFYRSIFVCVSKIAVILSHDFFNDSFYNGEISIAFKIITVKTEMYSY